MSSIQSTGLLTVLALLGAGCLVQPREPNCPETTDCAGCLAESGCGFCAAVGGGCLPGTSYGPNDSTACSDASWRFTSCSEPPPVLECGGIRGCSECMRREGCGFCPSAGDCRDREHAQDCELESDPESQACRAADCRAITDCAVCAEREECGYCLEAQECRLRESSGGCELTTDPASLDCDAARCQAITSCESCVETESCGWCLSGANCRHREYPGGCNIETESIYGVCDSARCRVFQDCSSCLAHDCEWCDYWNTCNSRSDDCPDAYRIVSECPPPNDCADQHSCEECLGRPYRCVWCDDGIYFDGHFYQGCVVVDGTGDSYATSICSSYNRHQDFCPETD